MANGTWLVYLAVGLVAVGLGWFVFSLFPARRPAGEAAAAKVEVHPSLGAVQQSSLGRSLVSAIPTGYAGWLDRQIVLAGRPIGSTVGGIVTRKLVLGALGALAGTFVIFATGGPNPLKLLLAGFVTVLCFFLPDVRINSRAHDRQEAIKIALPDTLDQMTIAVEAGLGFDAAMAKAARGGKGPLAEELIRVLQDMSIGRTRRDSFTELERRTNVEDLQRFIRAIIQADAYGIAIGDVLRVQAGEMRLKRRQRAEEQAMKVPVKILFPLVFCLLPVLFIIVMTPAVIGIIDAFS
ncbi:type II secretion system F family protein [Agromyces sp. NPDC056965]|uniref:type II secretion system F family protein n=1 Tax=Agromyces sp. NPDC056965 TaxID=3345983 RepID=UPI00363D15D7